MTEDQKKKLTAAAKKSDDLMMLLDKARQEPKLMGQLMADPDTVIRKNGLMVDPESPAYQELRLRLHHMNTILGRSLDELMGRFGDPGRIPGLRGPDSVSYSSLVGGLEDVTTPVSRPTLSANELADLKRSILADLRSELDKERPQ